MLFTTYRNDPVHWGPPPPGQSLDALSGLFPALDKTAFGTKTIAGVAALTYGSMDELLKPGNACHAAIKEEMKTRVIISTPMDTFVKTCYVLDFLGKPGFLNSTISRPKLLTTFCEYFAKHYSAIDASKFDHNVPKWLLRAIWDELATALLSGIDPGCAEAADICLQLASELDDLVVVEVLGVHIKYEKGLLSGWRSTSLVGSLASTLCCESYVQSLECSECDMPAGTVGYI